MVQDGVNIHNENNKMNGKKSVVYIVIYMILLLAHQNLLRRCMSKREK